MIVAFLGINRYDVVTYELDEKTNKTKFFPKAVLDFYPDYQLKMLMTEAARKKYGEELKACCSYEEVGVPNGENEEQLWSIFKTIVDEVPEDAKLVLDITNGFRSLPILALAACVYLRVTKNVTVERIVYGAFEARTNKDGEQVAPVFDLMPFLEVIDWSNAIRIFLDYGNAAPLRDTITHRSTEGKGSLRELADSLEKLTQALAVVRPIEALEHGYNVKRATDTLTDELINKRSNQPLLTLLEKFETRLEPLANAEKQAFSEKGFKAQAAMVQFYLDTEQYTQAVTLAREAITSKICVDNGYEPLNRNHRQNKANRNISKLPEISELVKRAKELRDDLNHAGMSENPEQADEAISDLREVCQKVAAVIRGPAGSLRFSNDNS